MRGYKSAELAVLFFLQKSFVSHQMDHQSTFHGNIIYSWAKSNLIAQLPFLIFNPLALDTTYTQKNAGKKWCSSSAYLSSHWVQTITFIVIQLALLDKLSLSCYVRNIHLVNLESTRWKAAVTGEIRAAVPTEIKPTHSHTHGCRKWHPFLPLIFTPVHCLITIISQIHTVHKASSKSGPLLLQVGL